MTYDIVIPTVGRPSLRPLVARLVELGVPSERIRIVEDGGPRRGPAAARNRGWRASTAEWVVFLDDDVLPESDWLERLETELAAAEDDVAGVQGLIRVPLPPDRRPTDWERSVHGLESARWATADMTYRRVVLGRVGGFDERFLRAFREDADVALRAIDAGWRLVRGTRTVVHPVGRADRWESVRRERGNADDALMRALHGCGWDARAGARVRRRPIHLAVTAAGIGALAAFALGGRRAALPLAAAWLAGTLELAWRRIAPGPRDRREVTTILATSALIPSAASFHWLAGLIRARRLVRPSLPEAVLLDRDGTLVLDVPYNGDPERVEPVPGAREALARLRAAGVRTAVVSNQSGIGRGVISAEAAAAVNGRVDELLGPLGPVLVCPHAPGAGCDCRKPSPGLVYRAAAALGVRPDRCAVVGDVGADVEAAAAAGARGVLVPTQKTRPEEVAAAPEVAPTLGAAVDLLLGAER
jgi:histidinol-phosphate phosphatase family protein